MSRSLVIARVGRKSLHRCWTDVGRPREWDLYLCPFEDIGPQDDLNCYIGDVIPGPKWTGLTKLLNAWPGWRDYDQIWLPDDDILARQDDITAMFGVGRALDFHLFAPALHEASHYAHFIAMRNTSFFARQVGFVEIMIPCFRRTVLEELLPTFALSATGWGFGLDAAWPKILNYEHIGIIDGVSVVHTRPVGGFKDADLRRRVMQESDGILAKFACEQRLITFAGIGPDLREISLSPEALLVELVRGWEYLFDGCPEALRWLYEQQRCLFSDSPYPMSGLPTNPGSRSKSGS
ncbi:hypothetical protein [Methylobacterium frigidaeris]|uniref:DUF707 domain-containing protein n=1 Tax=Methylobacterium frigidaeris TaxID=2038277 RepID=A0AA37HGG9_9HYPH|nr:hypothetical protein [Methylobacterium frigidaeris]GJD65622.1 hypothetical protein MPEAHAMD_5817 [Methylobacterium frigidaeris]